MLSSSIFTNSAVVWRGFQVLRSGSSPTRGVNMIHTGWTGLRLASQRRWPRDRWCYYCWFWWLVMTCLNSRVQPFVCLQADCVRRLAWHFCHVTDRLQFAPSWSSYVQLQLLMFRWLHFAMPHWVRQLYRVGMPKPDEKRRESYKTPNALYTGISPKLFKNHFPFKGTTPNQISHERFFPPASQRSPFIVDEWR